MKLITVTFAAVMVLSVYAENPGHTSDLTAALEKSAKENKDLKKSAENYMREEIHKMASAIEKTMCKHILEDIKGDPFENVQGHECDPVAALDGSMKENKDIMKSSEKIPESDLKTTSSENKKERKDEMKYVDTIKKKLDENVQKSDEYREQLERLLRKAKAATVREVEEDLEEHDLNIKENTDHISDLTATLAESAKENKDSKKSAKKESDHVSDLKAALDEAVKENKDIKKSAENPVKDTSTFDSKKIAQDVEKEILVALQKDLAAKLDTKQTIKKKLDQHVQKPDEFQTQLERLLKEAEAATVKEVEKDLEGLDEVYDSNVKVKKDAFWFRRRRWCFTRRC